MEDEKLTKEKFIAELREIESRFMGEIADLKKKMSKRFYFWRDYDGEMFEEAKKDIEEFVEEKIKGL